MNNNDDMNLSFERYDKMELVDFAERLEKYINVEHLFVDESLVISLNAVFGAGKSTFLEMWKNRINDEKSSFDKKPTVVKINAWRDDYCGDPFISIISSLIEELGSESEKGKNLRKEIKKIGRLSLSISNQIVNKVTGVDLFEAGKYAEEKDQEEITLSDPFQIYEQKKNALHRIKEIIKGFISDDNMNILFFIDELDRCRPDYAISYLETIKHVFDIKGIVFILAVDRGQLECTARVAFGHKMNFPEYYRKFVQREIYLPNIYGEAYKKLTKKYVQDYLKQENKRYCLQIDPGNIQNIIDLLNAFQLTPRQLQEVFRILSHLLETDEKYGDNVEEYLLYGIILMSILKVLQLNIYNDLGNQGAEPKEVKELFSSMDSKQEDSRRWFRFCLACNGIKNPNGEKYSLVFKEAGFIGFNEDNVNKEVKDYKANFFHLMDEDENLFSSIYSSIEDLTNFES